MNFANKKVLLRVDFNVPLDQNGNITDDTRITAALPTIKKLLENNNAVILMSHLGRPMKNLLEDGSINKEKFTLKHLVDHLSSLLNLRVQFASDTVGEEAREKAEFLKSGEVLLLENTRFNKGEETGDEELAKQLSLLGDVFVNDAFGTAHREHASTATVAKYFESSEKDFGLLMGKEIKNVTLVLKTTELPYTAVIGGAKVSDKILLIKKVMKKASQILIGGGMAYTFIKAEGGEVGNSLVEEEKIALAKSLLDSAPNNNCVFQLPVDSIVADKFDKNANTKVVDSYAIPDGWMGLDIGPKAKSIYALLVENSKTILWNGPMGVFEMEKFAAGTRAIAHAAAYATQHNYAYSLIGGGDSVAAVNQTGMQNTVSFVSTGGGALLEFLEGKDLPGIAAIKA